MAGAGFGRWLRAERKQRGLTQTELARLTGLSAGYISMLECGAVHTSTHKEVRPRLDVVETIADALQLDRKTARLMAGYAPDDSLALIFVNACADAAGKEPDADKEANEDDGVPITRADFKRLELLLLQLVEGKECPLRQLAAQVQGNMKAECEAA